jgi:hypothetical protein
MHQAFSCMCWCPLSIVYYPMFTVLTRCVVCIVILSHVAKVGKLGMEIRTMDLKHGLWFDTLTICFW